MTESEFIYEFIDGAGDTLDTWRTRLSLDEVLAAAPQIASAHETMRELLVANEGAIERDGELIWTAEDGEE
jgi:hypothetical protein